MPVAVGVFHDRTLCTLTHRNAIMRPRHGPPPCALKGHPMHQDLSRRTFALALAGVVALPSFAMAQAYPSRPVTVVVAFSAGGNNDLRARQLGIPVAAALGQPVIV